MKNTSKALLTIFIAFFMCFGMANAVQSFSISPTTVSESVVAGNGNTGTISVTNTGNESINLSLTNTDLTNGSNTINLNLNMTSISDLAPSASRSVTYTYSTASSQAAGDYAATVVFTNAQNSSMTQAANFNVEVNATPSTPTNPTSRAEISIDGESDDKVEIVAELDEKESFTLRFENTGNVSLTNIQITVSDLDGEDSSDEIDRGDIDLIDDDGFDLDVGESENFEFEIDVPRSIDLDTYVGTITLETNENETFVFDLEVEVTGGDLEIFIEENSLQVRSGILRMIGEEGEYVDDYEFEITNDGDFDVNNIQFELDGDLEEEFTSASIPASAVTFSPTEVDLNDGDSDNIEVRVRIPENQASGTYFAKISAVATNGREYDDIRLELKVIGDIYIKEIEYNENAEPGDDLDVTVTVANQGSKIYRNVKLSGTLYDVDYGNSDLTESTTTFILDVNEEKEQTIRFRIPEDAKDGSSTLELRLTYDGSEVVEIEEVSIERPLHSIEVTGSSINPSMVSCENTVYSFMKVRNLGRYDEDVRFSVEIEGTNIKEQGNIIDLGVDDTIQKNFVLNIESLQPGTYNVVQKVSYADGLFLREENTLRIQECVEDTGGIIVNPINETNQTTGNVTENGGINLFGTEVDKTTVYLGSATALIIVLIIISLFFI